MQLSVLKPEKFQAYGEVLVTLIISLPTFYKKDTYNQRGQETS